MNDLLRMWSNTRMVVLTAMSASLYAAVLIPFKVLPIIPGVTELRPANAVPIICSLLFGPAGAWGAAIGNLIGDFFGGLGPGDLFGFIGNFLYGFIPYRAWEALSDHDPVPRSPATWACFLLVTSVASAACAMTIGWGLNLLGFIPFRVLANIVLFNDIVATMLIAPFLLAVIYPRVKRAHLLYRDVLQRPANVSRPRRRFALVLVTVIAVSGLLVGNMLSAGMLTLPWVPVSAASGTGALTVGLGLLPIFLLLVAAVALL